MAAIIDGAAPAESSAARRLARKSPAPLKLVACVVATPSYDFAGWVGAIEAAAKASGLKLMLDNGGPITDAAVSILITADPTHTLAAQAAHRVVLMSDLDGAARAGALAVGGNLAAGAAHASAAIAAASILPDASIITAAGAHRQMVSLWPGFSVAPPPSSFAEFGSEDEAAWATAMGLYRNGAPEVGSKVRWEPPIFLYDATRADHRSSLWEMDVTGPARHLVYGPYFALTPGRWRGTAKFAVDQHAAQLRYRTEWGTLANHAVETFTPGRSGVFEIATECDFSETAPAELRVIQAQGSLGGSFEWLGMELERIA